MHSLDTNNLQRSASADIKPLATPIAPFAGTNSNDSSQVKKQAIDESRSQLSSSAKVTEAVIVTLSGNAEAVQKNEAKAKVATDATQEIYDKKGQVSQPKHLTNEVVGNENFSKDELKQIETLKKRDAEVRRHEQAHAAVGGVHTGSPSYEYQTGPDGRQYAVGGEVSVDLSKVQGDPEATISKANQIKQAALAPENPSAQDRKVAAQATQLASEARAEIIQSKMSDQKSEPDVDNTVADEGVDDF